MGPPAVNENRQAGLSREIKLTAESINLKVLRWRVRSEIKAYLANRNRVFMPNIEAKNIKVDMIINKPGMNTVCRIDKVFVGRG